MEIIELREMLRLINDGKSHFNINEKWVRVDDIINQLKVKNRKKKHIIDILKGD